MSRRRRSRAIPEGIRITKVGLWYVLLTLLVAIAATNTGNNALYLVWSVMLAGLVVSGLISRQNVRRLLADLDLPAEIYANRPFRVTFRLRNLDRLLPRWFLLFAIDRKGPQALLPYLPRRSTGKGELEMMLSRRGRHRLKAAHVSSLFPFGLFRKGARYLVDAEPLVYPEIFAAAAAQLDAGGTFGSEATQRAGWGHDLHSLRRFRSGDDPRSIHWKQSARTGKTIFMERETEESRRLSILLDNGIGARGSDEGSPVAERFERLVSEAATAASAYLEKGFAVELVTRSEHIPFGRGVRQRLTILESLALIEACAPSERALRASGDAPQLRLGLERQAPPAAVAPGEAAGVTATADQATADQATADQATADQATVVTPTAGLR